MPWPTRRFVLTPQASLINFDSSRLAGFLDLLQRPSCSYPRPCRQSLRASEGKPSTPFIAFQKAGTFLVRPCQPQLSGDRSRCSRWHCVVLDWYTCRVRQADSLASFRGARRSVDLPLSRPLREPHDFPRIRAWPFCSPGLRRSSWRCLRHLPTLDLQRRTSPNPPAQRLSGPPTRIWKRIFFARARLCEPRQNSGATAPILTTGWVERSIIVET